MFVSAVYTKVRDCCVGALEGEIRNFEVTMDVLNKPINDDLPKKL
jgi:hypothetical protein